MDFDLIIRNATIVTASEILPPNLSIGIKSTKITAIATSLPISPHTQILDAEGAFVTPGGVDSHVHLAQDNAPTGDNWLTGSRSALAGGNTTIIAFATQKRADTSLFPVVEEYHSRARGRSYVDYGFHLILTRPSAQILQEELPIIVEREGITSAKLYMTYPTMRLGDDELLDVMLRTRELGMSLMIHAENADMIDLITKRLIANQQTLPKNHAIARPQIAESEATHRAIALSTLTSTPILLVHLSSKQALNHVRRAQMKQLLPIHAETCPHYLYLLSSKIASTHHQVHGHDKAAEDEEDEWAGARHVCAPPLRHSEDDLQGVWDAVANGTVNVISSDHAPSLYDHKLGKRKPVLEAQISGTTPLFKDIPNGLPGIETRLPLLFHAATSSTVPEARRISLPRFVALTSTNPARMYGLAGCKGSVAPGYDADLCIWYPSDDPRGKITITNGILHHAIDYTPFEGMEVRNWPRRTVLRGKVAWDRDVELAKGKDTGLLGKPGEGEFLKRGKGQVLVGRVSNEVPGMKIGERSLWM